MNDFEQHINHLGTILDLIWKPFRTSFWTENLPAGTRSQTRKLQFALKIRLRQLELSKSSSAVRTRPLTLLRAHGLELDLQNELQLELEHDFDLELPRPPTQIRIRTIMLGLERKLEPGIQRELVLELGIQD